MQILYLHCVVVVVYSCTCINVVVVFYLEVNIIGLKPAVTCPGIVFVPLTSAQALLS